LAPDASCDFAERVDSAPMNASRWQRIQDLFHEAL
jgi:hypothetical protein